METLFLILKIIAYAIEGIIALYEIYKLLHK